MEGLQMRFVRCVAGAVLAGAAVLAANGAAATIVAQDLSGTSLSAAGFTWGVSFVTPSGSTFHDITINFYAASGGRLATGRGYLFAAGATGLTGPGAFAASISSAGGAWRFAPTVTLAPDTRYDFYEDTALPSLMGDAISTFGRDGGFSFFDGASANTAGGVDYTVDSLSLPEPGAWGLMLAGIGLAGSALRGRRFVRVG
jgi:hypothetical protein